MLMLAIPLTWAAVTVVLHPNLWRMVVQPATVSPVAATPEEMSQTLECRELRFALSMPNGPAPPAVHLLFHPSTGGQWIAFELSDGQVFWNDMAAWWSGMASAPSPPLPMELPLGLQTAWENLGQRGPPRGWLALLAMNPLMRDCDLKTLMQMRANFVYGNGTTPIDLEEPVPQNSTDEAALIPDPTATPQPPLAAANTNSNIRAGPGTDYAILYTVLQGTALDIVGILGDRSWLRLADGGWIYEELVDDIPLDLPVVRMEMTAPAPTATPQPAPAQASTLVSSNIRSGPGLDFPILRQASAGTGLEVDGISQDRQWLRLADGGWIYAELVTGAPEVPTVDHGARVESVEPTPLVAAAPQAALPTPTPTAPPPTAEPRLPNDTGAAANLETMRLRMLRLINEARLEHGLSSVELEFNAAAQNHAAEMAVEDYLSHWNRQGLTPYMRHTLAGGQDYSAENAAARWSSGGQGGAGDCFEDSDLDAYVEDAMEGLMNSPGHRANILTPEHRQVSIGFARSCHRLAVVQLFEGEYIRFDSAPSIQNGRLSMSGRVLGPVALDQRAQISLYWDPIPQAVVSAQLNQTFCYAMGRPVALVIEPLAPGYRLEQDWVDSEWQYCITPFERDPAAVIPDDPDTRDLWWRQLKENAQRSIPVQVPILEASVWTLAGDEFRMEADLRSLLSLWGSGVYTVVIQSEINGSSVSLTQYALFVR